MKVIDYKKVNINKIIYKEPIKTVGGCLLSRHFIVIMMKNSFIFKHLD